MVAKKKKNRGVRVKVKICGITNIKDALVAIKAGCDALGFAFFKESPRYLTLEKALSIIRVLPKGIVKIGVFVNSSEKTIKDIARRCCLDILQFHGEETPGFCRKFKQYKIIKVFRVKDRLDLDSIGRYKTFAYLFDTFVKAKPGGTGKTFNWELLRYLDDIKKPIFLSGGLNAQNVRRAIKIARPAWVDVCSSVEAYPGKKNPRKVRTFIRNAKKTLSQ